MERYSSPLTGLMQEFNITISGFVTSESENLIDSSPQTIISNEPAGTIAWTSKGSWSEVEKNMKFDEDSEIQERLGIVSTLQYGKGKVVVITDDAVFLDKFIDTADNRKLWHHKTVVLIQKTSMFS